METMIRGKKLESLTSIVAGAIISVALSSVGAYIAVTKAQANHETRITNVEATQKEQPASIEKAEQRINNRLDSIQTDVREIRKGQTELLQEFARQR